jgi:hypothetical protein
MSPFEFAVLFGSEDPFASHTDAHVERKCVAEATTA